jgi:hypothetical protein
MRITWRVRARGLVVKLLGDWRGTMQKILIAAFLLTASCSSGAELAGAEKAVAEFHQQLNSGDYQAIYAGTDQGLKAVSTEAEMVKLLTAVHIRLGLFQSGSRTGWRVNYNTSGNNTVIAFYSKYEKGKATETFTFVGGAQSPRLLSYNINSPVLITG